MDKEMRELRAATSGFGVVERIVRSGVGCARGMAKLFDWAEGKPGGSWKKLRSIDWTQDLAPAAAWLADFTARNQPPETVRGLWFGAPEFSNLASLDWCACKTFDPKDEMLEWACEGFWPDAAVHTGSIYTMRALDAARAALGFGKEYNEKAEIRESVSGYLVPLAYTSLLVAEVLAAMPPGRFGAGVGAAVGFSGGDWIVLPRARGATTRAKR